MLYIKRCATVVSFQQLAEEEPEGFGPEAPVHSCPGQPVAKYSFASGVVSKQQRRRRVSSDDSGVVPDLNQEPRWV